MKGVWASWPPVSSQGEQRVESEACSVSELLEPPASPAPNSIPVTCVTCGADIQSAKAKFCPSCGARLSCTSVHIPVYSERRRRSSIPFINPVFEENQPLLIEGAGDINVYEKTEVLGVGCRVHVDGRGYGFIRFIGVLHTAKDGRSKVGVELDQPKGKNDGSLLGPDRGSHTRYFSCKEGHGIFVYPEKITIVPKIVEKPGEPPKIPIKDHRRRSIADTAADAVRILTQKMALPKKSKAEVFAHVGVLFLVIGLAAGIAGAIVPRIWYFKHVDEVTSTLTIGIWTKEQCSADGSCVTESVDCSSHFGGVWFTFSSHTRLLKALSVLGIFSNALAIWWLGKKYSPPYCADIIASFTSFLLHLTMVIIIMHMTHSCHMRSSGVLKHFGASFVWNCISCALSLFGAILAWGKKRALRIKLRRRAFGHV